MGKLTLVHKVTMQSCGKAPHGRIRATHACIETYQPCIDDAARNRLIQVGNSPLAEGLKGDISLVHKDIARLHRDISPVHKDVTRLHREMYGLL